MQKVIDLLKQRRILSAVFGGIGMVLAMNGYSDFNASAATETTFKILSACSELLSMGLAIHSYFFPKKS